MGAKVSDEIEAVVTRKFGDEQSSLLDKFERLAFEAHLNNAIRLGRSLSEPGAMWRAKPLPPPPAEILPARPAAQDLGSADEVPRGRRRRSAALRNALKKLVRPIVGFGRRGGRSGKSDAAVVTDPRDPRFWKAFSASMRF